MTAPENKTIASGAAWFCLCSQPKHEHIAAEHLRKNGVEIFLPRIRFRRTTCQGTFWVTEALFPNYLFARFDWQNSLRQVQSASGIRGVVHFGERWPTIPEETIEQLRQAVGADQLRVLPARLAPGDEVRIAGGALRGLCAVISRVLPARERVAVLLEFLGRQTTVELPADSVIKEGGARAGIL
ncbi:MAG TPA: transcription termination/antitermination NusG family protein [Candidatus Aquilonibacter sp.]|nr:transcription termination/antitermination NusG family protein [Candidatus Aquilonibacter sp.]